MSNRIFRYDEATGEVVEVEVVRLKTNPKWPIASEAAGVHPTQIEEAKEFNRQRGLSVEYTPDGRPIFRSPGHRKQFLKAWKMHDRSGYD